jgi:CHAP domain
MNYPGRTIKAGETDAAVVRAVRAQLNHALGLVPRVAGRLDERSPDFDSAVTQTVKLFQARHVDRSGQPLLQDGQIGSITWEALFGAANVPSVINATTPFMARVVRIAGVQAAKPVREVPPFSNRGPDVEAFQTRVGIRPGLAWCCAFVYWCYDEAAHVMNRRNPMVRTAGCLDHWERATSAGAKRIMRARAVANPALLGPGMIFVIDHGGGLGHTGIIARVNGGFLDTIEGNTDASQSREGGGVYRLSRKIVDVNLGFIDYATA